MADRYWVGGAGNWTDAANHWAETSGGTPNAAFLPTQYDDVCFDDAGVPTGASCSVSINTSTGTCVCKNFNGTGMVTKSINFGASYYNLLLVYGSIFLNTKCTFPASQYYVDVRMSGATNETVTFNGGRIHMLELNKSGYKVTLQDAVTNTNLTTLYALHGEFDFNNLNCTFGYLYADSSDSVITMGSSIISVTNFRFNGGATLNAGTSTLVVTVGFSQQMVEAHSNHVFYNVTIQTNSTSGMPCLLWYGSTDLCLRVSNLLTIQGYDRKNMLLFNLYGLAEANSWNGKFMSINASNYTFSNVTFLGIDFTGNTYDLSGNETIGDGGYNTGATFAAPITAYYYQNTGNYCDAKWFTQTGGGGSSCRVPLPQDNAVIDVNSLSEASVLTFDTHILGGMDTSAIAYGLQLVLKQTHYAVTANPSYQIDIFGNVNLTGVTSISSYNNVSWNMIICGGSRTINLAGLTFNCFYLTFVAKTTAVFNVVSGFTATNYLNSVNYPTVQWNNNTYDIGCLRSSGSNILNNSYFTLHKYSNVVYASVANAGTAVVVVDMSTPWATSISGGNNTLNLYYLEIKGDNTSFLTFDKDINIFGELKIKEGMKIRFYGHKITLYKNYLKKLTMSGTADAITIIEANMQWTGSNYTQAYIEMTEKGTQYFEYINVKDILITGQNNIKKIEGVALASVKQVEGVVKSAVKRIMGIFVNGGAIATHSVDSGNNTGWIITP